MTDYVEIIRGTTDDRDSVIDEGNKKRTRTGKKWTTLAHKAEEVEQKNKTPKVMAAVINPNNTNSGEQRVPSSRAGLARFELPVPTAGLHAVERLIKETFMVKVRRLLSGGGKRGRSRGAN